MNDEVLSQEELDQLLTAISSGEVEAKDKRLNPDLGVLLEIKERLKIISSRLNDVVLDFCDDRNFLHYLIFKR